MTNVPESPKPADPAVQTAAQLSKLKLNPEKKRLSLSKPKSTKRKGTTLVDADPYSRLI